MLKDAETGRYQVPARPSGRYLDGKVALVTGGGAGIGRLFADTLAADGAAVAVLDVDPAAADAAAGELEAAGHQAIALSADISDATAVDRAVGAVVERLGGVDILVNNAALHLMAWSVPVTSLSDEQWRRLVDVNITGVVNCARACRGPMKERGGGVIVNMSSVSGIVPTTAYGVTKLAVRGLTTSLASELAADGVRVFCLAPGPMDSESAVADLPQSLIDQFVENLQLIRRPGRMTDLLGALRFFCSDESAFITGETIVIGGGHPLRL